MLLICTEDLCQACHRPVMVLVVLVSLLAVLAGAARLRAEEPAAVAQAKVQANAQTYVADQSKEMAQLR